MNPNYGFSKNNINILSGIKIFEITKQKFQKIKFTIKYNV